MTNSKRFILILLVVACVGASVVFAQRFSRRRGGYDRRYSYRRPVPEWAPDRAFSHDVFTFVRIRYSSGYGGRGYERASSGGNWTVDYPDSDLNFSFRLHQLTSMEVDPNGVVIELTDPRLFDYPFIYIVEPGRLVFSEDEVKQLRRYLLNGGFLMVDDFWGEAEWDNFYYQIKRVFPDREPHELPLSHDIFRCIFVLKEKPQIPSINAAWEGRSRGITWEPRNSDTSTPHYRAIYDDKGRMMAIICHNTDLGDGWEREGEDEWYFREFSEKSAYPLGINIVFYAMTH